MTTDKQCCGNCKWWDEKDKWRGSLGEWRAGCNFVLPDSADFKRIGMPEDWGTSCPCHKRKEEGDNNSTSRRK